MANNKTGVPQGLSGNDRQEYIQLDQKIKAGDASASDKHRHHRLKYDGLKNSGW